MKLAAHILLLWLLSNLNHHLYSVLKTSWSTFDSQHIWHPFTALQGESPPLCIERAVGAYLYTDTGRRLVDGISSWWVNIHGHANPRLAKVLYEQACTLEHVIFAGFTHPPAVQLIDALRKALFHPYERFFFSDNGSTAVEVALKMALQYHANMGKPRVQIISLEGGYHGDTFGAMSLGGKSLFTHPFYTHMFEVTQLPFPIGADAKLSLDILKQAVAKEQVAAFVFEPLVQAAAGMRMYDAAWLEEAISLCRASGTLCIADEVFTGFGRTGHLFATDTLTTPPDIITLSKGLTGGMMPMGITACQQAVCQAFESADINKTFFHGHSYTGNPLACRVAIESLRMLQEDEVKKRINKISEQQTHFYNTLKGHKKVLDARSLGTIGALTLKSTHDTGYANPMRKHIYNFFLKRNVLLRPLGNVLYTLPPYVIEEKDLAQMHAAIYDFLAQE